MKTLRRLGLILILTVSAMPLVILAQSNSDPYPPAQPYYGELIDYPGTGNTDNSGKLLVPLTDDDLFIPLPPDNNASTDDLDIPMPPDNSSSTDDLEIPMPPNNNSSTDDLEIPMPPDNNPGTSTDDLDIPMPPDNSSSADDLEIPMPQTAQPPAKPIKLIRGFYKQVGEPQITTKGICFDKSVGALGSCAANGGNSNEVHDFHNCWSNDPNSPNNQANKELTPVCQSADTEGLYISNPMQFFGRLTGSAYGQGSSARQMLQEGGVSIASYGVVVGTQIEVLSPTKFVVKYVHREQNGCERVVSVFYELSGQSEAACQQVIEVPPEELTQDPISTPPPLPPIEDNTPYTVSMPIIPAECTADTQPPEDFKNAKLKLDPAAGTLTINYGSGSYTAYQDLGSNFSYVDLRTNVFRLDFTFFSDAIRFHWYKTGASGSTCSIDGEMRPATSADSVTNNTQTTTEVKNGPYKAEWKPATAICTPETLAALPNFTQATITADENIFTVDYGTGSYPLTRQIGSEMYYYQQMGNDGSMVIVSINSHTPDKFSLLYQYSDASGKMCMATLDLTN